MSKLFPLLSLTAALATCTLLGASPADARIRCQGAFQVMKHGLHESPYCSEQTIARVARSYGYRVTDEELHRGDLTKVRICREIGGDNRLKEACAPYNPRGRIR